MTLVRWARVHRTSQWATNWMVWWTKQQYRTRRHPRPIEVLNPYTGKMFREPEERWNPYRAVRILDGKLIPEGDQQAELCRFAHHEQACRLAIRWLLPRLPTFDILQSPFGGAFWTVDEALQEWGRGGECTSEIAAYDTYCGLCHAPGVVAQTGDLCEVCR